MLIRVEPSSGVPITRQIMDQIRTQCASGALAAGDKLPSVRELARQLAVNQNTILRVYERLTAEGLIERRHGDGTYVAEFASGRQLQREKAALADEVERLVRRAGALGVEAGELHRLVDAAAERVGREIPEEAKGPHAGGQAHE